MANAPEYQDSGGQHRSAMGVVGVNPTTGAFESVGGGGGGGTADSTAANQVLELAAIGATNSTAAAALNTTTGLNGLVRGLWTQIGLMADAAWASGSGSVIALLKTIATRLPVAASTATLTNVASQATNITILAANSARLGCVIVNDDANPLLIKFGATASATSYTHTIPSGGDYTMTRGELYTGIIDGLWTADGTGSARVTELTA